MRRERTFRRIACAYASNQCGISRAARSWAIEPKRRLRHYLIGSMRASVENVSDTIGEVALGHRLLDHFDTGIEAALMNDGIARIAGHEEHFQIRPQSERLVC